MAVVSKGIIPTSNGSYQQLTPSASPAYARIQADDGGYIYCTSHTSYQVSTFHLSANLIPKGSIIDRLVMMSRFWTPMYGRCMNWHATLFGGTLRTHSSVYQASNYDNILTDTFYSAPDGTPWLREDLDNIEFGAQMKRYDSGGHTSYWEYLLVTVYYTPPRRAGGAQIIGLSAW